MPLFINDRGSSLVEYAFLVCLIALVCLGATHYLGEITASMFQTVGSSISGDTVIP